MININNRFPNEKEYRRLIKEFPGIDIEITKSYLIYILLSQKTIARIESYLSKIGMTNTQFLILLLLYVSGKKSENVSHISGKLGLSNVTISNVVQSLLKKELVEKQKLKEDKRYSYVMLSKKGKDFIKNFIPEYYLKYKDLFGNFDKDELVQLQFLILKLNFSIDSMSQKEKFWW